MMAHMIGISQLPLYQTIVSGVVDQWFIKNPKVDANSKSKDHNAAQGHGRYI
jgi:hypothetical protein